MNEANRSKGSELEMVDMPNKHLDLILLGLIRCSYRCEAGEYMKVSSSILCPLTGILPTFFTSGRRFAGRSTNNLRQYLSNVAGHA